MMHTEPEFKRTDGIVIILRRKPGIDFETVGGITSQATPEVTARGTAGEGVYEGLNEGVKTVLAFIRDNSLGRVMAIAKGARMGWIYRHLQNWWVSAKEE